MCEDGVFVGCGGELGEAVAKVADAGENEGLFFFKRSWCQFVKVPRGKKGGERCLHVRLRRLEEI